MIEVLWAVLKYKKKKSDIEIERLRNIIEIMKWFATMSQQQVLLSLLLIIPVVLH